jgi:acyl carrier protein
LIKTGVLDSLGLLRLISYLEDQVGVTIDDEELVISNFETLNKISELVERKTRDSGRDGSA